VSGRMTGKSTVAIRRDHKLAPSIRVLVGIVE
jgi:hypothetical protein